MRNGNQTEYSGESSASTSLSSQQDVEDDQMIALVLSEEYAKLDGAVARRLTNLEPVPVRIPRRIPTFWTKTFRFSVFDLLWLYPFIFKI